MMSIPNPPSEPVFDLGAYVLGPNREQVLNLLSARIGAFVLEYASDDGRGQRPTAVSYRYLETVFD